MVAAYGIYTYTVGDAPSDIPYINQTFLNSYWSYDFYKFSVDSEKSFNLNLQIRDKGDDAYLQLFRDVSGDGLLGGSEDELQLIVGATLYNDNDRLINRILPAGNYLALVSWFDLGSDDYLSYKLSLSATPMRPSPITAPNLLPREYELGEVSLNSLEAKTITRTGNLSNYNTVDTYHFAARGRNDGVRMRISLSGSLSDADIRLIRDSNKNQIVDPGEVIGSSTSTSSNELLTHYASNWDLGNYDYFLQVYQYSGNPNYNLNMTFTSTLG